MIKIELFYKIVESEIRRKHVKYLKNQKCLPSDQAEPQTSDGKAMLSAATDKDDFVYSDKPNKREKAKRVKAFNKGIESALKVLLHEYKRFEKRVISEE